MKSITKILVMALLTMSLVYANEKQDMQESIKLMKEAYQKAGIDMTKRPTPQQLKIVQEYMGKALFPKQKKEILLEAKSAKSDRVCIENADTLKEANACVPHDEEKFTIWNESEKSKTLKEIDDFIKAIPCVKKASTMQELRPCFPEQD